MTTHSITDGLTAAQAADIISKAPMSLADTLREAPDPEVSITVEKIGDTAEIVTGWASEHHTEASLATIRWTWHSARLGATPRAAYIIEASKGGRTGGEGWVYTRQHVIIGELSAPLLHAAILLVMEDRVPVFVDGWES